MHRTLSRSLDKIIEVLDCDTPRVACDSLLKYKIVLAHYYEKEIQ